MTIESHVHTPGKPKRLDDIRSFMRRRHYSIRTEQAYLDWIRRFILFYSKRHPNDTAEEEITDFLTHLATVSHVSVSTQKLRPQRLAVFVSAIGPSNARPSGCSLTRITTAAYPVLYGP